MPNRHILVIEDDVATLTFMVDVLELYGYEVTPRPTSDRAVEYVEMQQPDLVILDHRLDLPPNGFELLQQLRAQTTTAHVSVILYSAEGAFLDSHCDDVRSMGGDILHKPFELHELLAKIEALTLLSNER